MKNLNHFAQKSSEKVLKSFLTEIKRNGFTSKVEPFLNKAWKSNDNVLKFYYDNLKGVKFRHGEPKLVKLDSKAIIYTYEVEINDVITEIAVQPLYEIGVPYVKGDYGVIPVKLIKFKRELKAEKDQIDVNDEIKPVDETSDSEQ